MNGAGPTGRADLSADALPARPPSNRASELTRFSVTPVGAVGQLLQAVMSPYYAKSR